MRKQYGLLWLTVALAAAGLAAAQDGFPAKPVRILVGLGPGSGNDVVARLIAQKMTENLGNGVVVDNRVGAGGVLAGELLVRSPPDGYTLCMVGLPTHAFQGAYYKNLPYSVTRDFAGVSMVVSIPQVLVVSTALHVKTAAELIEYAKARPGRVNYGSAGIGVAAHTIAEQFNFAAGIKAVHVPFKGMVEALTSLVGGDIQFVFASVTAAAGMVKADKLVALAVSSKSRSPALPEVPALAEVGMPGFDFTTVYGLLAPAKTPKAVKDRLAAEVARGLAHPDMPERLLAHGATARTSKPEEFDEYIRQDYARMVDMIRVLGIITE